MQTTVNSVSELLAVLEQYSENELMFRGQSRDWPLLPAIGRFPVREFAANWRVFHEYVIEEFMRNGSPFFSSTPESDVECWVFAQHHGLPTRLLDTALNPLKAIHFAVADSRDDKHDGVLWVISYSGWRQDLHEQHRHFWDSEVTTFLPARMHPRLTAQEGAFICYPLPDNSEPLPPLDKLPGNLNDGDIECHKVVVPAKSKPVMRREISKLGARHSLLFPDLDGVAREITLGLLNRSNTSIRVGGT